MVYRQRLYKKMVGVSTPITAWTDIEEANLWNYLLGPISDESDSSNDEMASREDITEINFYVSYCWKEKTIYEFNHTLIPSFSMNFSCRILHIY